MPLYLVRHPHLEISIIKAANVDELQLILDRIGNPEIFEWKEYRGPLWVTFAPPLTFKPRYREDRRPMDETEFELEGVAALAKEGWRLKCWPSEEEMEDAITAYGYPTVKRILDNQEAEELDPQTLEGAIKKDTARVAWRIGQRVRDPK